MRRAVSTLLVAAMVVLAGCGAATSPGATSATTAQQTTDGTTTGGTTTASGTATASDSSGDGGTVNFYVSDERNAIGAFSHLNVTVSRVGFQRADATGNESAWVERDVDDVTVDLTELQGANATVLDRFDVPNGTYSRVFVYVSGVNGTVDGERVNVKLPSQKLHVNHEFAVGNGEEVDFVFDITVTEAGKSGKFVLKPVVSESGTEVPIERVDDRGDDSESDRGDDHESDEAPLSAAFVGNVTAGGNATVRVTQNGSAVENATLSVDGSVVARTDADGTATVPVSADAEALEVAVRAGDREVELSRELAADAAEDAGDGAEDAASDAPLNVTLDDAISEDGEATVVVTRGGEPVANAAVEVDGDVVGHTGSDGRFPVSVPASGSLNVTVRAGGDVATLERDAA